MKSALDMPCPACGGTTGSELASGDGIREEVQRLWAFHGRRLRPGVPAVRLVDRLLFSHDPPGRVVVCDGCRTILREPREGQDAALRRYAAEEPAEALLVSLLAMQCQTYRAQVRRLTRLVGHAGEGLEVGSYAGAFLAAAREGGWSFEGVDVNPRASRFARSRGFAMTEGTIDDVAPTRRFDAVAIWNCFEQVPDPRATAGRARALLAPGGVLALRVPNGAFYASLRRRLRGPLAAPAAALLALNNLLSFPYRHGFTASSLTRLLLDAGFVVERLTGGVLMPTADRWTRPWAALEERTLKRLWRPATLLAPTAAPWIEAYARRRD